MAAVQVVDFARQPIGAELRFVSARGRRFRVRIIGNTDPRYGNGRMVQVLEAPVRYRGSTILFVAPSSTKVGMIDAAYRHGKSTIGVDDIVFIVGGIGAVGSPRLQVHPFRVQSVAVCGRWPLGGIRA